MLKKLVVLVVFILLGVAFIPGRVTFSSTQDALSDFKNNNCVQCHSGIRSPLQLTSHYADWHISVHKEKAVGCEKCHGGDPGIKDQAKAHDKMLPSVNPNSPLHPLRLADTCNSCHKGVVNAFVESKHYQNLKGVGLGPSCSTCHTHMVTEVAFVPEQTGKLCAGCHDSSNTMMPKRPEIPVKATETMQAIRRANVVVLWADRLLEEAKSKKMAVDEMDKEMKIVRAMMTEAKESWHAFNLDAVRKKADAAFEEGTKVKDTLRKKLYPNS